VGAHPGAISASGTRAKRAGLEQRMRDLESGLFHHPGAVQQEVEVDLAGSPALAADPSMPSSMAWSRCSVARGDSNVPICATAFR